MEKELSSKVVEWIEISAQKIGDFATSEIPPFIHEYLAWKFWEAAIEAFANSIFPLIVLVCIFKYSKRLIKWTIDNIDCSGGASIFISFLIALVLFVPSILMFPLSQIKDMIQIKIAPKVYLVEKAAEILKDKN